MGVPFGRDADCMTIGGDQELERQFDKLPIVEDDGKYEDVAVTGDLSNHKVAGQFVTHHHHDDAAVAKPVDVSVLLPIFRLRERRVPFRRPPEIRAQERLEVRFFRSVVSHGSGPPN
jgi:hypothetical protein